jgi:proline iminopeptidase
MTSASRRGRLVPYRTEGTATAKVDERLQLRPRPRARAGHRSDAQVAGRSPGTAKADGQRRREEPQARQRLWLRAPAALAAPSLTAAACAVATPRGPLSAAEALLTMAATLAAGGAAGYVLHSRWALLLAPVSFALVFELARVGTDGPTVDGIHLSTYGLIAFGVGRGVHGLLALVPLALGAALGATLARRREPRAAGGRVGRAGRYARRGVAAVTGLALVALAVAVARPAATEPIRGADGQPVPGSIAELTRVEVGGHELALMLRGHSTENPVLLVLAGGPGGSELGAMRRHLSALERDFVVATWDQRGTGKSYAELDPASTLTLERAVADALEVTRHLRRRFGQERIYLVGQSWGTLLGALAVREHPELYAAFVGAGQMVSPQETDRIFYADTLAWARARGDEGLAEQLVRIGPPPYDRMLDYETALAHERDVYAYDRSRNAEGAGGFSENLFVPEYTLLEQIHALGAFMDTFSVLYPRIQHVDLRRDAAALDVPVYLVQGRHEARGRAEPAREWFDLLRAPSKRLVVFETSGHRPLWEQPDRFHQVMTRLVLAETRAEARTRRSDDDDR